ncbi:MAG TPA: glycosyltransferase family A protein [Dehalococcoidia bacterium]|nr:glycosyltransferase family A protein [Dehalococcoidia bacterium]
MNNQPAHKPALISVAVCTRGRGDSVARTVSSLLKCTHPCFEVIVVDQNEGDVTADALAPMLADPRLRYVRSATVGKGIAANIALAEARGEVVALTDDDCEVPPNWLQEMQAIFTENPKVAVAYCNVVATEFDSDVGFIPGYERSDEKVVKSLLDKCTARGIGAGMAVRRSTVLAMGGFDSFLGPGGRFHACVDGDLTVRALLLGYQVYETARVHVSHFGFRSFQEGRSLSWRYAFGTGAAYSKPLKSGYWRFSVVIAYELLIAALPLLRDAVRLRRPRGAMRVIGFLQGFAAGLRTPVDRRTLRFLETGRRPA